MSAPTNATHMPHEKPEFEGFTFSFDGHTVSYLLHDGYE